jgi:hypothetical protein
MQIWFIQYQKLPWSQVVKKLSVLLFTFICVQLFTLSCVWELVEHGGVEGGDGDGEVKCRPNCKINIRVNNAHADNTNKSIPAPALQLWAVTTRYETSGYNQERVLLESWDGGITYEGTLPLRDGRRRTVIIFDDVVTKPHPYSGYYNSKKGSVQHYLIPTDNVFSPCSGFQKDDTPLADLVQHTYSYTETYYNYFDPPWIPKINIDENIETYAGPTDEVYITITNRRHGNKINVDYRELHNYNTGEFCHCNQSINLAKETYIYSTTTTITEHTTYSGTTSYTTTTTVAETYDKSFHGSVFTDISFDRHNYSCRQAIYP